MNKNQSLGIWLVVGILVLALASMLFAGPTTSTKNLSYTEFLSKVRNAEIKEVVIDNDTVIAKPVNDEIKTNIDGKESVTASLRYNVTIPVNDTSLYPVLEENNVDVEIKSKGECSPHWLALDYGWDTDRGDVSCLILDVLSENRKKIMNIKKSGIKRILKELNIPEGYMKYLL